MKIILFFSLTGLAGYVLGYFVGRWTTEQKLNELRQELGIEEDMEEWEHFFNGGNKK